MCLTTEKYFRAVYSDSDVYLLDDILSAVDSQVASWILHRTILGPLMNQKTRILCTHNPQVCTWQTNGTMFIYTDATPFTLLEVE